MKPLRDALILLLAILVLASVRVGPAPGEATAGRVAGVSPALASPATDEAPGVVPAVTPRKGCKSAPEAGRPDPKDLEVARKSGDVARPCSRT